MAIQHRDIPDGERHELKGASTAIVGAVPVADGVGSSPFQKLGVASFTGSIPTGVADLVIGTDGSGGFKALTGAYGSFSAVQTTVAPFTYSITQNSTPQGITIPDGNRIRVAASGFYLVACFIQQTFNNVEEDTSGPVTNSRTVLSPVNLIRTDNSSTVVNRGFDLVYLDASLDYRSTATANILLWKMSV